MGLLGAAADLTAAEIMVRRLGDLAEPYHNQRLLKAAKALTVAGAGLSLVARRGRAASALAGAAYLAAGICTRFGVYRAGVESTKDPKYVIMSQKARPERGIRLPERVTHLLERGTRGKAGAARPGPASRASHPMS
jgi:hypothetical protein